MAKENNIQKQKIKPVQKASLHTFIATGGKPKDFKSCQGVSDKTVTGIKKGSKKS